MDDDEEEDDENEEISVDYLELKNRSSWTALHHAAYEGHFRVV